MHGQFGNHLAPQHSSVWLGEAEEAGRGNRLPFTSLTNLIWFQLRHLSGMWGFDFCVSLQVFYSVCIMRAESICGDGWGGVFPVAGLWQNL